MSKFYFNFPVSLIPPLYEDCYEGMNYIIDFGLASFAVKNGLNIKEAALRAKITPPKEEEEYYRRVQKRYYDESEKGCRVFSSIEKMRAFKFRDAKKSMKDDRDEIFALCCALAVRSIIGTKQYALISRKLVLSRMSGIAKSVGEECYVEAIRPLVGDVGRRRWRKAVDALRFYGCAVYVPRGCRGFYASFRLSPVQLATAIEKRLMKMRGGNEYLMGNEQLRALALESISKSVPHK